MKTYSLIFFHFTVLVYVCVCAVVKKQNKKNLQPGTSLRSFWMC